MSPAAKGKIALTAFALFAAWITLIVLLAGGEERATAGHGQTSRASLAPSAALETTSQAPATVAAAPSFGRADTPRTGATLAPDASPETSDSHPAPTDHAGGAARGGADGGADGARDGAGGTHEEAHSLSSVDRDRIIAAANSFVVNAYGYTGHDREQYEAYLNQSVIPSTFEASPASKTVEEFAARVGATGTKSEVMPKDFRISGATEDGASVLATFDLTDPSGERTLSQKLEVVSLGSVWKVASAGELGEARSP